MRRKNGLVFVKCFDSITVCYFYCSVVSSHHIFELILINLKIITSKVVPVFIDHIVDLCGVWLSEPLYDAGMDLWLIEHSVSWFVAMVHDLRCNVSGWLLTISWLFFSHHWSKFMNIDLAVSSGKLSPVVIDQKVDFVSLKFGFFGKKFMDAGVDLFLVEHLISGFVTVINEALSIKIIYWLSRCFLFEVNSLDWNESKKCNLSEFHVG